MQSVPKICISSKGVQIPSLLDLGSEVSLIKYSHLKEHLLPKIEAPTGEKSEAHVLFNLTAANDGQLPVKKYVELDINFGGLKVPNVGFPIIEEPNRVLDKKHQTKPPGIIGWNMIWLMNEVFVDKYGKGNLTPLSVLQELIHSYFLTFVCIIMLRSQKNMIMECSLFTIRLIKMIYPLKNWLTWLKKVQPSFIRKDGLIGHITIGTNQQPICIPGNSTITILGCTNKLPPRITCLVEQVEHHNLLLSIWINQCVPILKAITIPVIIINTNKYNVWIKQPLLAVKLFDVECNEVEYKVTMNWEGDNISALDWTPILQNLILRIN